MVGVRMLNLEMMLAGVTETTDRCGFVCTTVETVMLLFFDSVPCGMWTERLGRTPGIAGCGDGAADGCSGMKCVSSLIASSIH
jgi:hypothetical protein